MVHNMNLFEIDKTIISSYGTMGGGYPCTIVDFHAPGWVLNLCQGGGIFRHPMVDIHAPK